jgi:hypothetical protein
MGNFIKSFCRICNFEKEFRFGGNRFDYLTNCPVPAINKNTLEFDNVNYYDFKDSNDYYFYFNEELQGENITLNTFGVFDLKLNQNDNYCPNCKNFTLDFRLGFFY